MRDKQFEDFLIEFCQIQELKTEQKKLNKHKRDYHNQDIEDKESSRGSGVLRRLKN